jgi:hypothetical protein
MKTRMNISRIVRNVFAVVGAAVVMASPALASGPSVAHGAIADGERTDVKSGTPRVIQVSAVSEVEAGGGKGGWIDPRVQIADYDQNGIVDATDLYVFFTAWDAGKPTADINGDGWIDAADVWYYLAIWNSVVTGEGNGTGGTGSGKGK